MLREGLAAGPDCIIAPPKAAYTPYAIKLRERKHQLEVLRIEASENPNDAHTLLSYANTLGDDGQWDAALSAVQRARLVAPELAHGAINEAWIYYSKGQKHEAINVLSEASESLDDQMWLPKILGLKEFYCENYDASVEYLSSAVNASPDDRWLLATLAVAYLSSKKYDLARSVALRAIAVNPDYSTSYFTISLVEEHLKDYDASARAFQAGVEREPLHLDCYRRPFQMLLKHGKLRSAFAFLRWTIQQNPSER